MKPDTLLHPSERLDDLLTHDLKIIQSHEVFCFSMDAVLLARFATVPSRGKIMDLCTGNGVIPLLLSTRTRAKIDGIDIQERLVDMAIRSVTLNQKEDQISVYQGDVKDAVKRFGNGVYDMLTCNPPYLPLNGGEKNLNLHHAIARHEMFVTLEEIVRVSAQLVRSGGKIAYVYRAGRLAELLSLMRTYRIEPKRIRMVHPRRREEANIVLVEGIRDGGIDLKILPPLIVYEENGEYTKEIHDIYYGNSDQLR